MTAQLGGVPDLRPITFMTGHAASYPALQDSSTLVTIQQVESRLNAGPVRYVIPKEAIGGVVNGIRDGDIIAAVTTVAGLDVSHTGFAIWKDGELHLMHAPLTGSAGGDLSPAPRRADQDDQQPVGHHGGTRQRRMDASCRFRLACARPS